MSQVVGWDLDTTEAKCGAAWHFVKPKLVPLGIERGKNYIDNVKIPLLEEM